MKRCVVFCPLLLVAIFLSVDAALGVDTARENTAIQPQARGGKWGRWHEQMKRRLERGNVDLIFVGDSITQGWKTRGKSVWDTYYGGRHAVNLGISGDRTQHVLWRLDHCDWYHVSPKLAVVMIGTNNARANTSEEIAEGVTKIVETLRAKLPKTKVLLLAIFPRGPNRNDKARKVTEGANAIIAKLADGRMVLYQDIGKVFMNKDRTISKEMMHDFLHPGPRGYKLWAEAIEPTVAWVLSGSPKRPDKLEKVDSSEEGFTPLFDGATLDGWEKKGGGATYTVEDGCIVGRVGKGPNTFLCTKKQYGNFILKLKLKFDTPVNSGIQIRSHERKDGRVFGYQCEVDPSKRGWSGGIYDEARRGWLFPLAGKNHREARKALRLDDWNEIVIKAVGPSIKTWINGVPCADLIDDVDAKGFIGLQVHRAKKGQIRWKDIRIKELK